MPHSLSHYAVVVQTVADQAVKTDLVTIPECSCASTTIYVFGGKPEHYQRWRDAAYAWARHAIYKTSHWGVHWKGKHVLHVQNRYGITTLGGATRLQPRGPKE